MRWHHYLWPCCVSQSKVPAHAHLISITTCFCAWWQVWMCVDQSFNVVPCDTVCRNHPCHPIHPCGNTITFADDNFSLVEEHGPCQLGPCVAHTGTCHK